jgi:pyridoxal phosphate enzyme (YggS family)
VSDLAQRYREIVDRIDLAAKASNRSSADVTLVVVTKNHPHQLVLDLLALGARDFGENRDQEAAPKAKEIARLATEDFRWHFVGQLQTNKVKTVLEYANFIHSLDRESLLTELQKRTDDHADALGVFIQVNLTEDPDRGGVRVPDLMGFAEKVVASQGLKLEGLMGVGGLQVAPEAEFEKLANLSVKLQKVAPGARGLSMGMSSDFEVAIGYGATHLRIGTAITGNRPQ